MDVQIQAKGIKMTNLSNYNLEKLKTDISLSRDLSAVARNYIDTAIENRELELRARDNAFVEMSELKAGENIIMTKKELKKQIEFLNECMQDMASEHIEDCNKYDKKISNLHISLNKQYDKVKRQAAEITLLLQQKEEQKRSDSALRAFIKIQFVFLILF